MTAAASSAARMIAPLREGDLIRRGDTVAHID
jgi:hypothetical protein